MNAKVSALRFSVLVPLIFCLLLSADPLPAQEEEPEATEFDLEGMKKHLDAGTEAFNQAGDTNLDRAARNKHLKIANTELTAALMMIHEWCEAHPEDSESMEDYCCDIARMRYFVRKEAPNGVLDDDPEPPRTGPPPDWPPEPPPDLHEPALPPGEKPPPPDPEKEAADRERLEYRDSVKEHLKFAEDYARKHPYDEVGLRDLYIDILEHAPPGTEVYEIALNRFSELNSRLKDCYRKIRGRDLDECKRSGSEVRLLVTKLSKDLRSKEPDIRLRAAQYLGKLGSGEAAHRLVPHLFKEKKQKVREAVVDALTEIGGARVAKEIAKAKSKRDPVPLSGALRVLQAMANRSEIEARLASVALGNLAHCKDDDTSKEAISVLAGLGPAGVFGLMEAARIKDQSTRIRVLRLLGETGDGRAADVLGGFLVYAAKGKLRGQRETALEAIRAIGKPCVPYMGRFIGNPRLRQWTALILHELTGVRFKTNAQVQDWWRRNG